LDPDDWPLRLGERHQYTFETRPPEPIPELDDLPSDELHESFRRLSEAGLIDGLIAEAMSGRTTRRPSPWAEIFGSAAISADKVTRGAVSFAHKSAGASAGRETRRASSAYASPALAGLLRQQRAQNAAGT
jgi:hypothetical protein